MDKILLHDLFLAQKELDATIAENHQVSYATTRKERTLALIVEIGELANATRCFKYWSNKGSEPKDIVLDEYADGLHFFLSLGIDINTSKEEYDIIKPNVNLTEQFHNVYLNIVNFYSIQDEESYIIAFSSFLSLLPLLGYTSKELCDAYFKKLDTNYNRQRTNY